MRCSFTFTDRAVSATGAGSGRGAAHNPVPSLGNLQQRADSLLRRSLAENTRLTYNTALNAFQAFQSKYCLNKNMPYLAQHLVWFIAYCFENNCSPNTIRTYIAGINYIHKINGFQDIHTMFVVNRLLEGCVRSKGHVKDTRRPITKSILNEIG